MGRLRAAAADAILFDSLIWSMGFSLNPMQMKWPGWSFAPRRSVRRTEGYTCGMRLMKSTPGNVVTGCSAKSFWYRVNTSIWFAFESGSGAKNVLILVTSAGPSFGVICTYHA